ncbi:24641_t:CDS:2, partial [Racocetra persica]
ILMSIDEEVVNLSVPRKKEDAQRNTSIKDFMRRNDVQKLATAWYDILKDYCTRNQDVAEMCLKIIGLYISWIDISLIVNESFITLIYQLLGELRLRIAACECLAEIVCKGMKPLDKFELIQVLNLADVMRRLDLVSNLFVYSQLFADINDNIHPHKTISRTNNNKHNSQPSGDAFTCSQKFIAYIVSRVNAK